MSAAPATSGRWRRWAARVQQRPILAWYRRASRAGWPEAPDPSPTRLRRSGCIATIAAVGSLVVEDDSSGAARQEYDASPHLISRPVSSRLAVDAKLLQAKASGSEASTQAMHPETMDVEALAAYLRIPHWPAHRLAAAGSLPGVKVGRHRPLRNAIVDEWLIANGRKNLARRVQTRPGLRAGAGG